MNDYVREEIRDLKVRCIEIAINTLLKRDYKDYTTTDGKRVQAPPLADEVVRYAHKLYRYVEFGDTPT